MEIIKLNSGQVKEFTALLQIFKEVFESEEILSDKDYLAGLLNKPDFLVFVAMENEKVIGGLTVYVLHSYQVARPMAYIYDVGVATAFQRQGIGKSLLAYVCNYCKDHAYEDVFVQAEAEDAQAVNFYRQTDFTDEMPSIQFVYRTNEIFPKE
jgi:aminoglycoside 3-N-acetyltransferase I